MDKINRIKQLIELIQLADNDYYIYHKSKISDKQYDDLYFELKQLEAETGVIFPNSPTCNVSYSPVSALEKINHDHKMLSLDKTKDLNNIKSFLQNKDYIAMAKMDGLTCSLTYINGELVRAETRGDGATGENILHNAKMIPSIPHIIPYKEKLVVDGEIICPLDCFEQLTSEYKNPRNYASGTIRLLNGEHNRFLTLSFVAWEVIEGNLSNKLSDNLDDLIDYGFTIVPFSLGEHKYEFEVENIQTRAKSLYYPIDGLVFKFDDIDYGKSLGATSHHAKNAIAYKFYDESYPTELLDIEYNLGRTGVLTPVAIFKPIDIDGCEVSRASLHNLTIMEELLTSTPFKGQYIEVAKMNMIIPQIVIADKNTIPKDEDIIKYPTICPICGESTEIICENMSKFLYCSNPNCEGKWVNKLNHFCSKKGLDIKGLSEATLSKLIEWGWISSFEDIYKLAEHRLEWIGKPGFGQKSVDNILQSIEKSKNQTLDAFISAIGIPLIGVNMAKELLKHINSYEDFREKTKSDYDFSIIDGFAENKHNSIVNFDYSDADKVSKYINFIIEESNVTASTLNGVVFVITGRVEQFANRAELSKIITSFGGKVVSSISNNVNYLINNDINSTSAKNQAAKKLNIPIVSEKEFLEIFDFLKN